MTVHPSHLIVSCAIHTSLKITSKKETHSNDYKWITHILNELFVEPKQRHETEIELRELRKKLHEVINMLRTEGASVDNCSFS